MVPGRAVDEPTRVVDQGVYRAHPATLSRGLMLEVTPERIDAMPYEMAIELGGDEPPTDGEVERFLGQSCAEKLMELTGRVVPVTADNAS